MRNIGKSSGAASVVLVGLESDQMGAVRETLAAEAVLPNSSVSFGDAIPVVERTRPDVVIVGYMRSVENSIALAEDLTRTNPNVVLVALSNTREADQILAAMRAGYKEFVVLPDDASRLRQVVHELSLIHI